jgi:hypothetical protein
MSTNALVAYVGLDGTVTSSYVHYDGYTTGVGEMLLENYNTDKCARDLASCLGYASSLRETIADSHEDRANSDEAIVHATFAEFEKYVRENSYLEYAYVWTSTKWFVGSYTLEVEGVGRYAEYNSTWNGWEELVTVYVREGRETVYRWAKMAGEDERYAEYADHSKELEILVDKWNKIGMTSVVNNVVSEWRTAA